MSEFRNAFYVTCKKHDIEHPKWRKCPKCEEVVTYSEEEVYELIKKQWDEVQCPHCGDSNCTLEELEEWFNNNKKK